MDIVQENENWKVYSISRDAAIRDALFVQYQDWARWIALRLHQKVGLNNIELAEFEQYAFEGLLEAIANFSCDRDVQFKTYAEYRVKGAILNSLPSISEASAYYCKRGKYIKELSSTKTDSLGEGEPIQALVHMISDLSVSFLLNESEPELISYQGDYYSSPEMMTMSVRVKNMIKLLKEPSRTVINCYYTKGLSFTKIAEILNLTRGRISQCHKQGLAELKRRLGWS